MDLHYIPPEKNHNKQFFSQGNKYAATINGVICECGDTAYRVHGQSDGCNIVCPGDNSNICGGSEAAAVFLAGK